MPLRTNAFPLSVPEINATVYSIDPQPHSDIYSTLGYLEYLVERNVDGKAQKWTRPGTDDWFIAVVGASEHPTIEDSGTTLEPAAFDTLELSHYWDRMAVQRSINDSLRWLLTTHGDYWYHDDRKRLYSDTPRARTGEFDVYTGFTTRVAFHENPQLVVETKTTFVGDTLAKKIEEHGIEYAEQEYGGRNFLYDRPTPTNCQFHGVSRDKTVSDPTVPYNGDQVSVIEYVREEHGEKYSKKIDPDEPLVQIRYGESDPYDAAPSLLQVSPRNLSTHLTNEAALSAEERYKTTLNFINDFDYIQIHGERVQVEPVFIEPSNQGTFTYPTLRFADRKTVEVGQQNAVNNHQQINPGNWRWVIKDYLEHFGFYHSQRKQYELALVHPDGFKEQAETLYSQTREVLGKLGSIDLSVTTHPVCYDHETQYDDWVNEFACDVDGVLGVLSGADHLYHDIIDDFDGIPTQFIKRNNVRHDGSVDDNILFNTAIGLAVKLGDVPFVLDEPLSSDLVMGLSVTGDEFTNAATVLLDGETGGLLHQTNRPASRGQSTVSNERILTRMLEDGLEVASEELDRDIGSMVIHRNGQYGDEEIDTLWNVLDDFETRGVVADGFAWDAVEVRDNHAYRVFKDQGKPPDTGAYTAMDSDSILVTAYGEPQIHQGTPKPLYVRREGGTRNTNIVEVGRDVFNLSFLNWGSPTMKMKSPLSTQLPKKLNEILENTSVVRYPPF